MIEVICGIAAALIAYVFNRIFFKWQGEKSILLTVPLMEEASKTLTAFFIGGGIIEVHIIFGIIEAFYDLLHTKSEKAGPVAAISSIISHGVFGVMTYYVYLWTGWILLGMIITIVSHSLWNYFITR